MKISANGKKLITQFEGCRLTAYKPVAKEKYWTIGFGHCGPDVKKGMTITQSQADELFYKDVARFENYVNNMHRNFNQNEFDAMVSFTYNCGPGALATLCRNRSNSQIAEALLLYIKDATGRTSDGLVRRRKLERELFLKGGTNTRYKVTASVLNVRAGAGMNYKIVGTLAKGTEVTVFETSGDWAKIPQGWVHKNYLAS